jgi:hypothetical protein
MGRMLVRLWMAAHDRPGTAVVAFFAGVPGAMILSSSARPTASVTSPFSTTTFLGSASPEHYDSTCLGVLAA